LIAAGQEGPGGRLEGTVLRRSRREALVDTGEEIVACVFRGKLHQGASCVAGDRVLISWAGSGTGVLEEILPRRSQLCRGAVTGDPQGRVTASNVDQVVVVISSHPPPPRWALVDRLLVEAELEDLKALVVVNKMDLAPEGSRLRGEIEEAASIYRALNFPVHLTSALTGEGLSALETELLQRKTVLSGHSGVGKSTILNRLIPEADIPTGEVNPATGKGRQTTTSVMFVKLPGGGYVADTPGFREFGLVGLNPADLGRCYPEFREVIGSCRFKDCLHLQEPGCALRGELEAGKVSKLRYQNYLQILRTLVEKNDVKSPRRSAR